MISDNDTQKYLSMIEDLRAKTTPEATVPPRENPASSVQCFIDPTCDIRGRERMRLGHDVVVQKDCWLNIAYNNPDSPVMIDIGEGTNIGRRCTISAANRIMIGKNVLLAPNVFIADTNHEYQHVGIPIMHQGITTHSGQVCIGDDAWIGINSVIVGNVTIGRHCVIGANAVVTKDIPDYCVAVGNPCRIIKIFDISTGSWVRVQGPDDVEEQASKRGDLLDYVVPLTRLTSLQVEVSSSCNLQCPQCFQYAGGHTRGFFTKDLWDKRVRPVLAQLGNIHLVGIGEPLLCKDFFSFVQDAVRQDIAVHTTSNLQLVDEGFAEKIVLSGIRNLSFSCDGASAATYESIRVKGRFRKLERSLEMINRQKGRHNSPFPVLILNFGAMRRNIEELPSVVEFARKHNVGQIIAYHDVMYVPELKEESLYHCQELSDQKFTEAKRLADKYRIEMFFPGLFSHPIKYTGKSPYCGYPGSHLYIYSDGRVGPCCMDFPDRYILGDINGSSLEEVWNSTPILKLRNELAGNPSETCRYCVSHGKMDISDPRYFFRFKGGEEYLKTIAGR
jgi:radical SAM protein with 4Fe4S-binding SPASM domain